MSQPIWTHPHPGLTQISAFRRFINFRYTLQLETYDDIHAWTVTNVTDFAESIWIFCSMKTAAPPQSTLDGAEGMYPPPRWFPGATLNYTENMLHAGLALHPDSLAVTSCREGLEETESLTFRELELRVAKWANVLRSMDVRVGDRVVAILTNSTNCLLALLAAGAVGAIFSSASPEMGQKSIMDRFSQLQPKVLFCETSYRYGNKTIDLRPKIVEVSQKLRKLNPERKTVIAVVDGPLIPEEDFVEFSTISNSASTAVSYAHLPFDHPIYILFSSGTTGPPKCICHSAGGALLQQKKELMLQLEVTPKSVFYQFSTTGWMMWNFNVACLSIGARIVIYDGSPLWPNPGSQLHLLESQSVTHWGTSPKFLASLKLNGVPHDISLRVLQYVGSAGAPLSAEMYQWFYTNFPKAVGLFNGSGGTDLVAGIIEGSAITDVFPGEISAPGLGMDVDVWDDDGRSVTDGSRGHLVIKKPFFSMPVTFWGPGGEELYRKAYFSRFPGVWYHGDYIRRNPQTGGYEVLGRSDGVLNPGGVRFGTAELYGVLDRLSEVVDCIAVSQKLPHAGDERVLLFVKMKIGTRLNVDVSRKIQATISAELSPRHVPNRILQVADIPYNISGKKMESLVRDLVSGQQPSCVEEAVVNPECLQEYREIARHDTPVDSKF